MKYTVVNDSGARAISQDYDTIEEAQARLDAMGKKSPGAYSLKVAGVDDDGALHDLDASDPDPKPAPARNPSRSGPTRRS